MTQKMEYYLNYKLTTQGFPGKDIHPSFSQAQQDEMYSINFSSKHNDKQDHKSPDPLPKRYSDQLKLLLLGDFMCSNNQVYRAIKSVLSSWAVVTTERISVVVNSTG